MPIGGDDAAGDTCKKAEKSSVVKFGLSNTASILVKLANCLDDP